MNGENTGLVIVACRLESAVGDHSSAIHALLQQNAAFKYHPELTVSTGQELHSPVIIAPVLSVGLDAQSKSFSLLTETQLPLHELAKKQFKHGRVGSFILLPPANTIRANAIGSDYWQQNWQSMSNHDEYFRGARQSLCPAEGAMHWLQEVCHILQSSDEFDAMIFTGVDSLLEADSLRAWHANQGLSARGHDIGFVPGEGAAAIMLRRESDLKPDDKILARIRSISAAKAASDSPNELAKTIDNVLSQAQIKPKDIPAIIHNTGNRIEDELEWHDVAQQHFGSQLTQQQRIEIMRGQLDPADLPEHKGPRRLQLPLVWGDVGAAALPMQIAVAIGGFAMPSLQADRFLLVEAGEGNGRGALLLERPEPWPQKVPVAAADDPFNLVPIHPRDN